MFKWDGSDITEFINNSDTYITEAEYNKNVYWVISNGDNIDICSVKTSSNESYPCLIDEMKPAFGLEKIGTHWFKFGGKYMILIKLKIADGCVIEELTLKQFPYSKRLEPEVQKIFVFRELLGIMSKACEGNIILRNKKHFVKPISAYNPNLTPSKGSQALPNTVLEKWFSDISIGEVILIMLKEKKTSDLNAVLLKVRKKLEKIVERVNRNGIIYIDEILSRLRTRLEAVLE